MASTFYRFGIRGPVRSSPSVITTDPATVIQTVHSVDNVESNSSIRVYNRGGTYVVDTIYNIGIPETISVSNPVFFSDYYSSTNYTQDRFPDEPPPPAEPVPPIPQAPDIPDIPDIPDLPDPDIEIFPNFNPGLDVGNTYTIVSGARNINIDPSLYDIELAGVVIDGVTYDNRSTAPTQIDIAIVRGMNVDYDNPSAVLVIINVTPFDPTNPASPPLIGDFNQLLPAFFVRNRVDATRYTEFDSSTTYTTVQRTVTIENVTNLPPSFRVDLISRDQTVTIPVTNVTGIETGNIANTDNTTAYFVSFDLPESFPLNSAYSIKIQNTDVDSDFTFVTDENNRLAFISLEEQTVIDRGQASALSWARNQDESEKLVFTFSSDAVGGSETSSDGYNWQFWGSDTVPYYSGARFTTQAEFDQFCCRHVSGINTTGIYEIDNLKNAIISTSSGTGNIVDDPSFPALRGYLAGQSDTDNNLDRQLAFYPATGLRDGEIPDPDVFPEYPYYGAYSSAFQFPTSVDVNSADSENAFRISTSNTDSGIMQTTAVGGQSAVHMPYYRRSNATAVIGGFRENSNNVYRYPTLLRPCPNTANTWIWQASGQFLPYSPFFVQPSFVNLYESFSATITENPSRVNIWTRVDDTYRIKNITEQRLVFEGDCTGLFNNNGAETNLANYVSEISFFTPEQNITSDSEIPEDIYFPSEDAPDFTDITASADIGLHTSFGNSGSYVCTSGGSDTGTFFSWVPVFRTPLSTLDLSRVYLSSDNRDNYNSDTRPTFNTADAQNLGTVSGRPRARIFINTPLLPGSTEADGAIGELDMNGSSANGGSVTSFRENATQLFRQCLPVNAADWSGNIDGYFTLPDTGDPTRQIPLTIVQTAPTPTFHIMDQTTWRRGGVSRQTISGSQPSFYFVQLDADTKTAISSGTGNLRALRGGMIARTTGDTQQSSNFINLSTQNVLAFPQQYRVRARARVWTVSYNAVADETTCRIDAPTDLGTLPQYVRYNNRFPQIRNLISGGNTIYTPIYVRHGYITQKVGPLLANRPFLGSISADGNDFLISTTTTQNPVIYNITLSTTTTLFSNDMTLYRQSASNFPDWTERFIDNTFSSEERAGQNFTLLPRSASSIGNQLVMSQNYIMSIGTDGGGINIPNSRTSDQLLSEILPNLATFGTGITTSGTTSRGYVTYADGTIAFALIVNPSTGRGPFGAGASTTDPTALQYLIRVTDFDGGRTFDNDAWGENLKIALNYIYYGDRANWSAQATNGYDPDVFYATRGHFFYRRAANEYSFCFEILQVAASSPNTTGWYEIQFNANDLTATDQVIDSSISLTVPENTTLGYTGNTIRIEASETTTAEQMAIAWDSALSANWSNTEETPTITRSIDATGNHVVTVDTNVFGRSNASFNLSGTPFTSGTATLLDTGGSLDTGAGITIPLEPAQEFNNLAGNNAGLIWNSNTTGNVLTLALSDGRLSANNTITDRGALFNAGPGGAVFTFNGSNYVQSVNAQTDYSAQAFWINLGTEFLTTDTFIFIVPPIQNSFGTTNEADIIYNILNFLVDSEGTILRINNSPIEIGGTTNDRFDYLGTRTLANGNTAVWYYRSSNTYIQVIKSTNASLTQANLVAVNQFSDPSAPGGNRYIIGARSGANSFPDIISYTLFGPVYYLNAGGYQNAESPFNLADDNITIENDWVTTSTTNADFIYYDDATQTYHFSTSSGNIPGGGVSPTLSPAGRNLLISTKNWTDYAYTINPNSLTEDGLSYDTAGNPDPGVFTPRSMVGVPTTNARNYIIYTGRGLVQAQTT